MLKRVKDIKRVFESVRNPKAFLTKQSFKLFSTKPEVENRLSNLDPDLKNKYKWLGSEDEMRKHFNIIDWNEVEKEEKIQRLKSIQPLYNAPFKKKEIDEEDLHKITEEYRKKIFDFSNKNKIDTSKDDDYDVPEEVLKFERSVDMSKFRDENYYKNLNEKLKPVYDQLDYLKDKPNNYVLIGNIKPDCDIEELLIIVQSLGQVVKHNIINDLSNRPSLIEVYYYTDNEAYNAKTRLDGYKFNNFFLTARNYKDYEIENINSRTLIVGNLAGDLKSDDIIEVMSCFGNVMKVELPLEEIKYKNKKIYNDLISNNSSKEKSLDMIFRYTDDYFNEFFTKNDISNKSKLTFFYQYQKIREIMNRIGSLSKKEMDEQKTQELRGLYTQFKFHVQKIFPKEIVNSLIYNELIRDSQNVDLIEGLSNVNKEKMVDVYNKIFENMTKLIRKYDNKVKVLAEELTEEMFPVDTAEREYYNLEKEKLQSSYYKKAIDEKDARLVKNDLRQMNFYSLCIPLNKQIDKIKFYRSLTPEERQHVKDKYNFDFHVNTVQFIDYFLQFSKGMGMQIFDKQIELANLFLSMNPVEKQYLGRKLAEDPRKMIDVDGELFNFLDLKKRYYINRPYENLKLLNDLNKLNRKMDTRIYSMIYKSKRRQNTLNFFQSEQLTYQERIMTNYVNYWLKFIKNKRLVNIFMIRFNQFIGEIIEIKNKIFESGDIYIKKYADRIKSIMFPSTTDYYNKKKTAFMINNNEQVNLLTKNKEKKEEVENEDNSKGDSELSQYSEIFKPYRMEEAKKVEQLDPKLDFELKNTLDDLEHYLNKFLAKLINLNKYIMPKNASYDIFKEHIKSKMVEYANGIRDKQMREKALEKLEESLRVLKYVDANYEEKEFKMWQLVEDIVGREMEYLDKARNIKRFFKELEDIFVGPVDKDSLVKILGTYDVISKADSLDRGGYDIKQTFHEYFRTVQEIFENELEKVENLKINIMEEKDNHVDMDDMYNERKELIENYINKVYDLNEFKKLKHSLDEKTKDELDSFKVKQIGKNELFLESDSEGELELLKNEIRKKKFEFQSKNEPSSFSPKVDTILGNYKLENARNEAFDASLKTKVNQIINKQRMFNRGYAFVTFANSDQAKRVYLAGSEITIEGSPLKILPKLDASHEDFDFQFLKNSKSTSEYLKKKLEVEEARHKLNEFERTFKDRLDETQEDYKDVIEGYKDIFSDPYKRHDREFNPLDSDEETEIRKNIEKQEKESKLNHIWLYEDDKLDELRKIKDKKISKKYLEWQLLKRGIIPEKNKDEKPKNEFPLYTEVMEELIGEQGEIRNEGNTIDKPGRNNSSSIFGPTQFINKYLGKDMLEIPAFNKTKKISQFFQPIKELRERFPKEKFTESTIDYNRAVKEVKKDYINYLKENDKKDEDPYINTEGKILDKLSPASPVNQLIAPVLEERKNFIKEHKENITYQTFLQRAVGDNFYRADDFNQDYIDETNIQVKEDPRKNFFMSLEDEEEERIGPNGEELTEEQILEKRNILSNRSKKERKDIEDEKKKVYNEKILKHFEDRYDISKDPNDIKLLPYGFRSRVKKNAQKDVDQILKTEIKDNLEDKMITEHIVRKLKTTEKKPQTYIKTLSDDEDDFNYQFDENILSSDKIRDLKNRKTNEQDEDKIMTNVLNKFHSLNNENFEIKEETEQEILNKFESFIKDKNSSQFAFKDDELTRKNKKKEKDNYDKFKKIDNFKTGFHSFKEDTIKLEKDKEEEIENMREKIKLEKQKMEFFKDLSTNFKEELDTSPKFREFFEDLKSNKKYRKKAESFNLNVEHNEQTTVRPMQEVISAMESNNFDKDMYKKHFSNQKTEEQMIKEWIKPEEMDKWYKQGRELQGINNENEEEMYERLKLEYPNIIDDKFIDFSKNFSKNFDTLLMNMIESNDFFEDEYYFNPESNETIEQHLAKLSKFPNSKITVKKDQKGRYLIKREHKFTYKYDLDEIMNVDIKKEKEKIDTLVEEMDFTSSVVNEIEYNFQIQSLIQKNVRIKENNDLSKIRENMQELSENEELSFTKELSRIIDEGTKGSLNSDKKSELINNILSSFKQGKRVEINEEITPNSIQDNIMIYQKIKDNLSENLRAKVFKEVKNNVRNNLENIIKERASEFFGKKISILTLRKSILKIITLKENEFNLVLDSLLKITKNIEEIPIIRTSLDDNSISIFLALVQKSKKNLAENTVKESNKVLFIQENLLSSLFNHLAKGFNSVEKIMTYGLFNLIPEDVEFVKPNEILIDRSKFFNSIWSMFKNTIIKNNLVSLIKISNENSFLKEQESLLNQEAQNTTRTEEAIKKEINEYSTKIKNFYKDFIRLNTTEFDLENYISDIELFSEEISQQISNKLYRKKYLSKWNKSDFVDERVNEENLYRNQIKDANKLLDSKIESNKIDDESLLKSIQENIENVKKKKERLLKEQRPILDNDFIRII